MAAEDLSLNTTTNYTSLISTMLMGSKNDSLSIKDMIHNLYNLTKIDRKLENKPPENYDEGGLPILSDGIFSFIIMVYVSTAFFCVFYLFCWRRGMPSQENINTLMHAQMAMKPGVPVLNNTELSIHGDNEYAPIHQYMFVQESETYPGTGPNFQYPGNYEGSEMLHQSCGNNSPYLAQLAPAKYPTVNQDDVIRYSTSGYMPAGQQQDFPGTNGHTEHVYKFKS